MESDEIANSIYSCTTNVWLRRKSMKRLFLLIIFSISAIFISAQSIIGVSPSANTAIFAGGCFWSMQSAFEKLYGVVSAESGYIGGRIKNPTYDNYAENGFVEAVKVQWDPRHTNYNQLLNWYWRHTDPTDPNGAFVDRGPQYRPIIFYMSPTQRDAATASKDALSKSGRFSKPIATEILPASAFYPAEDYHQDFPKKQPDSYQSYYNFSGRKEFFTKYWGKDSLNDPFTLPIGRDGRWPKPSQDQLKKKLNAVQFEVTQLDGTEIPFQNEYYNKEGVDGLYVDIVSGEPLFSSKDMFDSGTGWPSFTEPLFLYYVQFKVDKSLLDTRVEVRSRYSNDHLGHVFDDGPAPLGTRYCMNSAALRFIPAANLEKEGYGQFAYLFTK
jgi:peptide methionine sulfoxide reductase msrA/msrB